MKKKHFGHHGEHGKDHGHPNHHHEHMGGTKEHERSRDGHDVMHEIAEHLDREHEGSHTHMGHGGKRK